MKEIAEGLLNAPTFTHPEPLLQKFMSWGAAAIESMIAFLVVLVIAIYFLADGKRVYEWIIAFLPERQRQRVAAAAPETFSIVFSYMGGQLVTSVLCSVFMGTALTLLPCP